MRVLFQATVLAMLTLAPATPLSAGQIAGRVLDPNGAPVPVVTVGLSREGEAVRLLETKTDASGQFRLMDLQPGTYRLFFESRGFQRKEVSQSVTSEGGVLLPDVTLQIGDLGCKEPFGFGFPNIRFVRIASGAELNGNVGQRDGKKPEGASVTLTGQRESYRTLSTAYGVFQFPSVTPGIYTLRVKFPGFADFLMESVEIRGLNRTEITNPLELRPCPPEKDCEPVTKVPNVVLCL